jgi:hypothetical protein
MTTGTTFETSIATIVEVMATPTATISQVSQSTAPQNPTESVQFDMRERFFLRTRVTYGSSAFDNLYVQNPTDSTSSPIPTIFL